MEMHARGPDLTPVLQNASERERRWPVGPTQSWLRPPLVRHRCLHISWGYRSRHSISGGTWAADLPRSGWASTCATTPTPCVVGSSTTAPVSRPDRGRQHRQTSRRSLAGALPRRAGDTSMPSTSTGRSTPNVGSARSRSPRRAESGSTRRLARVRIGDMGPELAGRASPAQGLDPCPLRARRPPAGVAELGGCPARGGHLRRRRQLGSAARRLRPRAGHGEVRPSGARPHPRGRRPGRAAAPEPGARCPTPPGREPARRRS